MAVPAMNPTRAPQLLRYRPWRGELAGPTNAVWAIARAGLLIVFRRKLFWVLYALATMIFLFFFFGQYLFFWIETQIDTNQTARVSGGSMFRGIPTKSLFAWLSNSVQLNGSPATYANLIWFEGFIAMIILALVGSVIVGNDFHHGSLPFYLAKPIRRRHYILGKALCVGVIVNMMTTLPALILFLQTGLIKGVEYYFEEGRLFLGILGYGLALTVTLSLLLIATSIWLRRTAQMVMIWTALFVLCRSLGSALVDRMDLDPAWRLIDLWNNLYLTGHWLMGSEHESLRPLWQRQPEYPHAALAVVAVCVFCLLYLNRRIRAVEVVA